MNLHVSSPAFSEGGAIPDYYTSHGENRSPTLKWSNGPAETQSYVVICDDPDAPAGTWVHWVVYDIPAATLELPEGAPAKETLGNGAKQGTNDFRRIGYYGPRPPSGIHHYCFKVYALNRMLDARPGLTKAEVLRAMEGHVLARGELKGRYQQPNEHHNHKHAHKRA
jgi:Raf kinase inhibitor-like YbhB/YbcL family protein